MDKYQNKYRIPSIRLQNWDYGRKVAYFITISTQGREHYFGHVADGKMNLSGAGIIADVLWHEIKNHAKNIELGEFVVMPDHIHGILILTGDDNDHHDAETVETLHATSLQPTQPQQPTQPMQPIPSSSSEQSKNEFMTNISPKSNLLSTIIRSYKSAVTKHVHRLGFDFRWQPRFHDHIIRNNAEYQRIKEYIINNPSKWNDG